LLQELPGQEFHLTKSTAPNWRTIIASCLIVITFIFL
jgi:hypothetical protein